MDSRSVRSASAVTVWLFQKHHTPKGESSRALRVSGARTAKLVWCNWSGIPLALTSRLQENQPRLRAGSRRWTLSESSRVWPGSRRNAARLSSLASISADCPHCADIVPSTRSSERLVSAARNAGCSVLWNTLP